MMLSTCFHLTISVFYIVFTRGSSNNTAVTYSMVLPNKNKQNEVVFYSMGDMPYSSYEEKLMKRQLKNVTFSSISDKASFLVHLGDIQPGTTGTCKRKVYKKAKRIFTKYCLSIPVFFVPGDNDYDDCPSPKSAWKHMKRYLFALENNWNHEFQVDTRKDGSFSFVHNRVLFVGLNVIGAFESMFDTRMKENLLYTTTLIQKHASQDDIYACVLFGHVKSEHLNIVFFNHFFEFIEEYPDISFLYLHGHGHSFRIRYKGDNFMRVQVDQGLKAPPIKVIVRKDGMLAKDNFIIERTPIY